MKGGPAPSFSGMWSVGSAGYLTTESEKYGRRSLDERISAKSGSASHPVSASLVRATAHCCEVMDQRKDIYAIGSRSCFGSSRQGRPQADSRHGPPYADRDHVAAARGGPMMTLRVRRAPDIYGDADDGKGSNINKLPIDDRRGHLWCRGHLCGAVRNVVGIGGARASVEGKLPDQAARSIGWPG
jgi:hypothetical protein